MAWASLALGLAVLGNLLWFSALWGWSLVTAPVLFRTLEEGHAGDVGIAVHDRYHHVGWWGSLIALSGFIVYALNTEVKGEWLVWSWSLPLLLASSLWWASWKKLVPKATTLWSAIRSLQTTAGNEEMLSEAMATFETLSNLSKSLSNAVVVLLFIQLASAIALLS